MPFCSNIKHKLKQQQLQQRLQQAQLLRRRMAMTTQNSRTMSGAGSGAPVQGAVMPSLQNPATPAAQGAVLGLPSPHQPGIGLKPGTQTPPANVLQVVKQVIIINYYN